MTLKHPYSPTTKKLQTDPSEKKPWRQCSGTVKASCCTNFSHQKQKSTATDTATLSKKFCKAIKQKGPGQLTAGEKAAP
jgi:hypothetical protein